MLMIRAKDTVGNMTDWIRMPYSVVNTLSGTKDTQVPTFIVSNEQELPKNNSNVELNKTIKVRAVDQGNPATGICLVGYRWVQNTSDSKLYTVLWQQDTITTQAPNQVGIWYFQFYAWDASLNKASVTTYQYNIVDTIAPTLTLNGNANMDVPLNGTFTDPGATFKDNYDAQKIVYSTDTVDVNM